MLFRSIHGSLIDHWGPKPVLIGSLVISAIGYIGFAEIRSLTSALVVLTITSFGQSAMWPSQSALGVEIVDKEYIPRYFGAQFAIMNLGLGLGGLIASIFVLDNKASSFEHLYFVDGASFIIYLVVVLFIRKVGRRNKSEREERSEEGSGWREVLSDKRFLKYWLIAVICIFSGYSQLEVGFSSFSRKFAHVSPGVIAWAFAANTFLIATCQLWFTKRVEKIDARKALGAATLFWILAWITLAISGLVSSLAIAMVIFCQVVFGIGEMIWSPVMPTIINNLAPENLRGRYNALGANAWQIAGIGGPMVAGALIGAQLQWLWIGMLVVFLVIAGGAAQKLNLRTEKVE